MHYGLLLWATDRYGTLCSTHQSVRMLVYSKPAVWCSTGCVVCMKIQSSQAALLLGCFIHFCSTQLLLNAVYIYRLPSDIQRPLGHAAGHPLFAPFPSPPLSAGALAPLHCRMQTAATAAAAAAALGVHHISQQWQRQQQQQHNSAGAAAAGCGRSITQSCQCHTCRSC